MEQTTPENIPQQPEHEEQLKTNLLQAIVLLFTTTIAFLRELLNIREGTHVEGTAEGIKRDVEFKGINVYILIFSIFIASIGLNTNSTAVIIGAMLISPLMGPIIGAGFSIGTNDFTFLIKSLKNLAITVSIALVTSTIYFAISPFKEQTSELLARTAPTLLDAIIALFGGFAGIIAGSRKEKSNVIPGVAIATALMPPLCTAGFGIATGNPSIFFGAFYLFLINSVFISISTYITVRYLEFPVKEFLDAAVERKMKRYISIFVIIVLIPSGIIFWKVIQKTLFLGRANKFVIENTVFEGSELINHRIDYNDSLSAIHLFMIGKQLNATEEQKLNIKLVEYNLLKTKVVVHQSADNGNELAGKLSAEVRTGIIEELLTKNQEILDGKNAEIQALKSTLQSLNAENLPLDNMLQEFQIQFPELDNISYGKLTTAKATSGAAKFPCFLLEWKGPVAKNQILNYEKQLSRQMAIRLRVDTVLVISN